MMSIAMITLMYVGCEKKPNTVEQDNVGVIIGNINNNPVFDCSIDEMVFLSESVGTPYAIISADGNPSLIYKGIVPDFSDKGYTKVMLERIHRDIQADLTNKIMEATPDDPETDIAAALALGVRAIRENQIEGGTNTLLLSHNGISTRGSINMIEVPIATMDIKKSVNALIDSLNIELDGIHVVWYYLSDVRGNQSTLSSKEEEKLKLFYETLLKGLGAESVIFKERLALDESYVFPEQPVSPMPVEGDKSHLVEVVQAEDVADEEDVAKLFSDGKGLIFDEGQIAFKPDTSEFLNVEAAKEAISYVVEFMSKNKDFRLLICGGCAGDEGIDVETKDVLWLSKSRGNAVKQIICDELGIDGSTIIVKGLGASGPFHTSGIGLGADAVINRNVTFLDVDSKQAQEILKQK